MRYQELLPYIAVVLDDSLNVVPYNGQELPEKTVLVGWQCGFEPMVVAVYSHLDVSLTDAAAEEITVDYLEEKNWFSGETRDCDFIVRKG